MESRTVYKIEIDGIVMNEEYTVPEKALEGATIYFARNHSLKEAKVFKHIVLDMGLGIVNKDYELPSSMNYEK